MLFGLIEFDAAGTVLYYRPEGNGGSGDTMPDIIGRNLFTDIAPLMDINVFQERLNNFRMGGEPADSFNFTFHFEQNIMPVKVLLARISERSEVGRTKSMFVHIRKAS